LFSKYDQNIIMRTVMTTAAAFWIKVFLPMRFGPYARTSLGYFASTKWEKRKSKLAAAGTIQGPQPTPFVYTGIARSEATTRARPDGTATSTRFAIVIRIPFGHPIQPDTSAMFKVVPSHEVKRLAEVVGNELPALINSGVSTYFEKGPQLQLAGATSVRRVTAIPRKAG
jgi:hypothetical protein